MTKPLESDQPVVDVNSIALKARFDWILNRLSGGKSVDQTRWDDLQSEKPGVVSRIAMLSQRFGLSRFEEQCLTLAIGYECVPAIGNTIQQQFGQNSPSLAICLDRFDSPAWDILSSQRPLLRFRLVEILRSPERSVVWSPFRCRQRITNYVKGVDHLDESLMEFVIVESDPWTLSSSQIEEIQLAESCFCESKPTTFRAVNVTGTSESIKRNQVAWLADHLGMGLYRAQLPDLIRSPDEMFNFTVSWRRESKLTPMLLVIDADSGSRDHVTAIDRLTRLLDCPVVFNTLDPIKSSRLVVIESLPPTAAEQKEAWSSGLGSAKDPIVDTLVGQFELDLPTIDSICKTVSSGNDDDTLFSELWNRCRISTRPGLECLANRIEAKATWHNLVLTKNQDNLLRQIAAQVRSRGKVLDSWGFRQRCSRGLSITALFAGESGTGKTLAGEALAHELQLDIYRIDLSSVINKYIGETEKNLRRLFDEAEGCGAILFFDEADALFGKRLETRTSHDRYANQGTNYLLQRIESYRGLAILATNNKSALDSAFLRRLRYIVDFEFPEMAQRKRIWETVFPNETPIQALEFARLAKLRLSGGGIFNIAFNSACLAASRGSSVGMQEVLEATEAEFLKTQRPFSLKEFGQGASV